MKIETKALWRGRTGNDKVYFHPRVTVIEGKTLMMTLQEITGSDYFHPVHCSFSEDEGGSWSEPRPIPGLGRKDIGDGITEGVCDVVPDWHPQTETILAIGHNVYYKDGHLFDSLGDFRKNESASVRLRRFPVYNVLNKDGQWLAERKKLECPELSDCAIYSCGCAQKVILPDGNIIIPLRFTYFGRKDRMVSSLLCSFDGHDLTFIKKGTDLELPVNRGLDEPSLASFKDKFYMTIRAEDQHAYFSVSDDGLSWKSLNRWQWEDGEELIAFSTQQHWLEHRGRLYLVYNRKNEYNINVMRWRSPLFIAEFDTEKGCLIRDTEQTVFPMVGDGVNNPDYVPMMGNFHPLRISDEKGIVTVGEMVPKAGYKGDTLIAHIN